MEETQKYGDAEIDVLLPLLMFTIDNAILSLLLLHS